MVQAIIQTIIDYKIAVLNGKIIKLHQAHNEIPQPPSLCCGVWLSGRVKLVLLYNLDSPFFDIL